MKNIEIFLIEVKQQVCDEEKVVEESKQRVAPMVVLKENIYPKMSQVH